MDFTRNILLDSPENSRTLSLEASSFVENVTHATTADCRFTPLPFVRFVYASNREGNWIVGAVSYRYEKSRSRAAVKKCLASRKTFTHSLPLLFELVRIYAVRCTSDLLQYLLLILMIDSHGRIHVVILTPTYMYVKSTPRVNYLQDTLELQYIVK